MRHACIRCMQFRWEICFLSVECNELEQLRKPDARMPGLLLSIVRWQHVYCLCFHVCMGWEWNGGVIFMGMFVMSGHSRQLHAAQSLSNTSFCFFEFLSKVTGELLKTGVQRL